MNAYSGPKLRQGSLCKYPGRHAFPVKFPHTLQLPAGSLTNTMLATVQQHQCYACKMTKADSDMFISTKSGTTASHPDSRLTFGSAKVAMPCTAASTACKPHMVIWCLASRIWTTPQRSTSWLGLATCSRPRS